MFSAGKSYKTTNIETAEQWHRDGKAVLVYGWVKASKAGKTRKLDKLSFEKILAFHNRRWKITTCPEDPNFLRGQFRFSYVRQRKTPQVQIEQQAKLADAANNILGNFDKSVDKKLLMMTPGEKRKAIRRGAITRKRSRKQCFYFGKDECQEKLPEVWQRFDELKEHWKENGKEPNVIRAFHGTKYTNVQSIFEKGFSLPYRSGMLGRGVYVGQLKKARVYSDGIILIVDVMLGDCKELETVELIDASHNFQYDSMHINSGRRRAVFKGWLANEEWVIRNPEQLKIVGIHIRDQQQRAW